MGWLYLTLAIVFEVVGTTSMKLSDGFTKLSPSVVMFVCYMASLALLTMALKNGIELGVAYAVWGGLGIALIVAIGCVFFGEAMTGIKLGCIALIIVGVVGLNVWGGVHAAESAPVQEAAPEVDPRASRTIEQPSQPANAATDR
jgi:small multidrug resistance pump